VTAMTEKEIILAFIQILPILLIWMRLESRLSRLEGRFEMFLSMMEKIFTSIETRHGP